MAIRHLVKRRVSCEDRVTAVSSLQASLRTHGSSFPRQRQSLWKNLSPLTRQQFRDRSSAVCVCSNCMSSEVVFEGGNDAEQQPEFMLYLQELYMSLYFSGVTHLQVF